MSTASGEKRLYPRMPLATKVVFEDEFGEGLFYVYSENISMGGLFLASDVPLKRGTMMFISFVLPGRARPVHLTGEVVRRVQMGGEGDGIGVRFVGLPADVDAALMRFMSAHHKEDVSSGR